MKDCTMDASSDHERYFCGDCVHWKLENGKHCPCKRLDHDAVKFAVPWFKSYDANQHSGVICADFSPKPCKVWAVEHWTGFPAYWEGYVKEWLPYGNTNTLVYFTLNGDTSIHYGVSLMDFVNGTMMEGNHLKAVEKIYYKKNRKTPYGHSLIREPIDGVEVQVQRKGAAR